jgi:hypothetical protein
LLVFTLLILLGLKLVILVILSNYRSSCCLMRVMMSTLLQRKIHLGSHWSGRCSCFIDDISPYLRILLYSTFPYEIILVSCSRTSYMSLVEQKLLTLPEHMSSLQLHWTSYCSIFSFLCIVLWIIISFFPCIIGIWIRSSPFVSKPLFYPISIKWNNN